MPSALKFAVTWDYRCPFARNGLEHIIEALEAGAPWDVTFVPFFLNQSHVPEGGVPSWEDPLQQPDLTALAAGIVVRDRDPDRLLAVHRSLFTARHDEGGDLRDRSVVAGALRGRVPMPTPYWEKSMPAGPPKWSATSTKGSWTRWRSSGYPPSSSATTPSS